MSETENAAKNPSSSFKLLLSSILIFVGAGMLYQMIALDVSHIDNEDKIIFSSLLALCGGFLGFVGVNIFIDSALVYSPADYAAFGKRALFLILPGTLLALWLVGFFETGFFHLGNLIGIGVFISWGLFFWWFSTAVQELADLRQAIANDKEKHKELKGPAWAKVVGMMKIDNRLEVMRKWSVVIVIYQIFATLWALGLSMVFGLIGLLLMFFVILPVYDRVGAGVVIPLYVILMACGYVLWVGRHVLAEKTAKVGMGYVGPPLAASLGLIISVYPVIDRIKTSLHQLKASRLRGGPLPNEDYSNHLIMLHAVMVTLVGIFAIWEAHYQYRHDN